MANNIDDDVREAVARCIPDNSVLRIRPVSARIATSSEVAVCPGAVARELMLAGVAAGVPIEIETPLREDSPLAAAERPGDI
ncbi:MAG TPA: hypothetical protein VN240_11915 [Propylenella sp.]|nr:hypothetical protein [Propylenella sp.]